jgi:actin-related protein
MVSHPTLVIELGSSLLRVGFAGEAVPRFIIPISTFPGLINDIDCKVPGRVRKMYTEFFQFLFLEYLKVKAKDYRVLVIEKFFTPKLHRDSILTSLLKDVQASKLYL